MTSELDVEINDSKHSEQYSDRTKDRDRDRDDDKDDDEDTDTDTPEASAPYSILPTDEDRETIINDALDELAEIARENILEFKREDFNDEEVVGTWIDGYLCQYFSEMTGATHRSNYSTATAAEADALNDVLDAYIRELYDELFERFYEEIAPRRVQSSSSSSATSDDTIRKMTQKIQTLREKPQPDQRTPEWYARRNNLITASAASKAFGSQASVNQLVYEKCKNFAASEGGAASGGPSGPLQGSVNSPLHWGQRYEPLTVMVYERRNQTKLGEFGCIQHDTYPFIGASPDGINIDPTSPIYGRMVEIKNIVNREITGKPKEEYWIQTQIQMEVCDLDECDFVETRFKEYDNETDYNADQVSSSSTGYTVKGNEKGIILWFQTAPALTHQGYVSQPIQLYEYAPIGVTAEEYDIWEAAVFAKHQRDRNIWVRTIYWYLDEYSCVLVRRNRLWFSEAALVLEQVWAMIEEERQTGFEHRAPAKRRPAPGGTHPYSNEEYTEFVKIVKLDTAIVDAADAAEPDVSTTTTTTPTTEVTATKMATMMSALFNNNRNVKSSSSSNIRPSDGVKRPSDGIKRPSDGIKRPSDGIKRPSDVLIKCFKIDDLDLDESKIA
jgi:putative phage-type endonuclease